MIPKAFAILLLLWATPALMAEDCPNRECREMPPNPTMVCDTTVTGFVLYGNGCGLWVPPCTEIFCYNQPLRLYKAVFSHGCGNEGGWLTQDETDKRPCPNGLCLIKQDFSYLDPVLCVYTQVTITCAGWSSCVDKDCPQTCGD